MRLCRQDSVSVFVFAREWQRGVVLVLKLCGCYLVTFSPAADNNRDDEDEEAEEE